MTTEAMVEAAHKALMSELFLVCQPDNGNVFSFMDDHPEVLAPVLRAALRLAPSPVQDPAKAFSDWLNEGPKLAEAAGLYVGIKVMSADHPEAVAARAALPSPADTTPGEGK